jgi:hypothetical protein
VAQSRLAASAKQIPLGRTRVSVDALCVFWSLAVAVGHDEEPFPLVGGADFRRSKQTSRSLKAQSS